MKKTYIVPVAEYTAVLENETLMATSFTLSNETTTEQWVKEDISAEIWGTATQE